MPIIQTLTSGRSLTNGASLRQKFILTIAANTQNYNLNTAAQAVGWNGSSPADFVVTINSGIYVWSDSTSLPGFTTGTLPSGSKVTITNNGYIIGKGGAGGAPVGNASANYGITGVTAGFNGGSAVNTTVNITIDNQSGYIGGGGGGGGVALIIYPSANDEAFFGGGGGAGGGAGSQGIATGLGSGFTPVAYNNTVAGGAGGSVGASGGNGYWPTSATRRGLFYPVSGAGGGRIIPGTGGAAPTSYENIATTPGGLAGVGAGGGGAGGAGGGYAVYATDGWHGAYGGAGGAAGGIGSNPAAYPLNGGSYLNHAAGGGGGWGASGGTGLANYASSANNYQSAGGAGGKAVALNGNTITWVNGSSSSSRSYGAVA